VYQALFFANPIRYQNEKIVAWLCETTDQPGGIKTLTDQSGKSKKKQGPYKRYVHSTLLEFIELIAKRILTVPQVQF